MLRDCLVELVIFSEPIILDRVFIFSRSSLIIVSLSLINIGCIFDHAKLSLDLTSNDMVFVDLNR